MTVNYAPYIGVHNVAAAVLFAVVYTPPFVLYFLHAVRQRTVLYITLAIFCAIRVTSFSIRAGIASSTSIASNLGLIIAYGVLSAIGYLGLLYSAFTVIEDRQLLLGPNGPRFIPRIPHQRHVMRAILSGAIALGVVGNINAYSKAPSTPATSHTLRETSIYVFLVMTVSAAVQAVQLAIGELNYSSRRNSPSHSIWVLEALMLLLLLREGFAAATVHNAAQA